MNWGFPKANRAEWFIQRAPSNFRNSSEVRPNGLSCSFAAPIVFLFGRAHPLHQGLKASITAQFNKMWVLPDSDQVAHVNLLGLFQPVQ